jgi:predicted component of type VI protein secretion system
MMMMMMRGMDDFFQNGISHQIQKEKTILMMMKMMKGMDDFFPNGISHQIQKEKNHIDEDEDDERNG